MKKRKVPKNTPIHLPNEWKEERMKFVLKLIKKEQKSFWARIVCNCK